MYESVVSYYSNKPEFIVLCRKKINASEVAINVNPMTIKTPRLLSDVAALNNRIAPASPRNSVAMPWITTSKDVWYVISGTKTPASNAKNASR